MERRQRIESPRNARFRCWSEVAQGAVREWGRTLVAGARLTAELATAPDPCPRAWIVPCGWDQPLPGPASIPVFEVPAARFRRLDVLGTHHPLLEVGIEARVGAAPRELAPGMHVALPVQDPVNAGAIIRSAAGLGATSVLLLPGCAHPFHPRAVRTSAGAVFHVAMHQVGPEDFVRWAVPVLLLDRGGEPIAGFRFPGAFVLLVGREGEGIEPLTGLRAELVRAGVPVFVLSLPMQRVESFNANVAAALAMYEWRRGRSG
jgi:tRNA G18 (ribose-2'-O)-methylase SpoU